MSASQSYIAVVKIPKLKKDELAESIKFQADKVVPMSLDQVKLDWTVINDDPKLEEQEVLLVATPNNVADKYLNLVQKAGFELLALEINAISQSRSLLSDQDRQKCVLVLDIGSIATDLCVYKNEVPILLRSISVGYKALKRITIQNLGVS